MVINFFRRLFHRKKHLMKLSKRDLERAYEIQEMFERNLEVLDLWRTSVNTTFENQNLN